MEPTIIFEDDDIIVLNKQAGVTVNISETTHAETTIQDWAVKYLNLTTPEMVGSQAESQEETEDDVYDYTKLFYERGGVVHRLDKETSGILLLAKNPMSFEALQKQFKERSVKKWYVALSHGEIKPSSGEINIPVGRLPWNRRQFGIVAGGRESVTFYKVLKMFLLNDKRKEKLSYLELEPKTGRTHQIRVHLKYLNHPIFADFLYAGRKTANSDRKLLSRVFLHAAKISFSHPRTHESVTYESPLPNELQEFLDTYCVQVL